MLAMKKRDLSVQNENLILVPVRGLALEFAISSCDYSITMSRLQAALGSEIALVRNNGCEGEQKS